MTGEVGRTLKEPRGLNTCLFSVGNSSREYASRNDTPRQNKSDSWPGGYHVMRVHSATAVTLPYKVSNIIVYRTQGEGA